MEDRRADIAGRFMQLLIGLERGAGQDLLGPVARERGRSRDAPRQTQRVGGHAPVVIATDDDRGWVLTDVIPGADEDAVPDGVGPPAARAMATLQLRSLDHLPELAVAGVPERDLATTGRQFDAMLAHSVELAAEVLVPAAAEDIVMAGQTRLMGVQDLSDLDRLRELFEAFASKREILQLLERTIQAPGVRIFIGEETGMVPLGDVSLVTAPYAAHG